jgi:hypothetical protein
MMRETIESKEAIAAITERAQRKVRSVEDGEKARA